jgi:poly(glycerol-phosphate) alpha-glucosyltransferase
MPIYFFVSVIPESFGGMVTVALQRSSAFADLDHRQVQILTKSPDMGDPGERARDLQESGRLSPRVPIRNVWSELVSMPDRQLAQVPSQFEKLVPLEHDMLVADGSRTRTRRDAQGEVVQTNRFREDGSLAISDRQDALRPDGTRRRLITVFTRDGRPVAQWDRVRSLYHAWMDWVIGDKPSILVIDSAPTGGLFFDYRRDHVTTVQAIHNHHMLQMDQTERGALNGDVMQMLTHLDWFDAVSVLTHGQQKDLMAAGVLGSNGFVGSNMLNGTPPVRKGERDSTLGVIVGRQVRQKRFDHALRALGRLRERGVCFHVDLYGNGPKQESLERLASSQKLGEHVEFKGYDSRAKDQFGVASFTVLSSRYEGQPMILLEAMSAGCIPVAYDMEYGPGDIITDGVDGFLVPDGDVSALAAAIERVITMEPRELAAMREAALRRARDFTAMNVTRSWGRSLTAAVAGKRPSEPTRLTSAQLASLSGEEDGLTLDIDVNGPDAARVSSAKIAWIGREHSAFGRVPAQMTPGGEGLRVSAHIDAETLAAIGPKTVLDVHVDLSSDGTPRRLRVSTGDSEMSRLPGGVETYATKNGFLAISRTVDPGGPAAG